MGGYTRGASGSLPLCEGMTGRMSVWKYIMFQDRHGRRFPVIFPAELVHSEMAEAVMRAVRSGEVAEKLPEYSCPEPVSAGFIGNVLVHKVGGRSETLGLHADKDDHYRIATYPITRGVDE